MTRIDSFLVVVGLPRSGTTLLTALLDAHPRLCLYYEPWNASPRRRPERPKDLDSLLDWLAARFGVSPEPGERIVGFKETTILPGSTAWAVEAADVVARECRTHVVWIWRDPILCLLSKLDGARKWWGNPGAQLSPEVLDRFLGEAAGSVDALRALTERHEGLVVQYPSLVRDPAGVMALLMEQIGERYEPAQLEYHRAGAQPHKVMGDVEVARQPAPVSDARERARIEEAAAYIDWTRAAWQAPSLAALREQTERLNRLEPVARLGR